MADKRETIEGYVVDIACLRKWPRAEIAERARQHTRVSSLEGHCAESGFGLVDEAGRIQLLDSAATPKVIEAVRGSALDRGIRLRVVRRAAEGAGLETEAVAELPTSGHEGPTRNTA